MGDETDMLRRVVGAVVALVIVGLLSSCSFLPQLPPIPGNDDTGKQADVAMQQIADAVKGHDAAALKKLFSRTARENSTDLDGGLKYFLSFFPSGKMTWELDSFASGGYGDTQAVYMYYKVSANGKKYDLYFADFKVDSGVDPPNAGLYALGVTPYTTDPLTASGTAKPFYVWAGAFDNGNYNDPGTPGVYVPQQ